METLEQLDQELFLWLNGLRAEWLDAPMWTLSQIYGTLPLLVLLLFYIAKKYNWRLALGSLLGLAVVVALSDRISVELFKEVFERWRPTHNLEIKDMVNTVTDFEGNEYRGGLHSFVSSHATNFFGMAMYYWMLIRPDRKRMALFIFGWAALVSYSRIYLGVHYPGDIVCGAVLGSVIGLLTATLFNKYVTPRLVSSTKTATA